MSELVALSATEALRRFRARELSPVELMDAVIEHAERRDQTINALCVRLFDEARAAARAAEARYGGRGPAPRPLEGLPVAIKDDTPMAGLPNSRASLLYRDEIATETALAVERIQAAGGIVHARTTCSELAKVGFTHSRLWGVTHNPWNPARAPGGSSGGSAAALAAGMTMLATGNDVGGSTRSPASACGVVGFKPPYGRVPVRPPLNLDHYRTEGSLARTVADCALLQNAIAGPHPIDIASLRPKRRIPEQLAGISGWRIAYSPDLDGYRISEPVRRNTERALDALREAGAVVEEVRIGWDLEQLREAARIHHAVVDATVFADLRGSLDLLTDYLRRLVEQLPAVTPIDIGRGRELEGRATIRLGRVLARYRALVCPTMAIPAFDAGESYLDHGPEVDGEPLPSWRYATLGSPFNLCARVPALTVPSGLTDAGLPTGIQIVARSYDDVSAFRIGAAIERSIRIPIETCIFDQTKAPADALDATDGRQPVRHG